MTTVYTCLNIECQYNAEGYCDAEEIELDEQGRCLAQEDE